jgi:hypothetical protein
VGDVSNSVKLTVLLSRRKPLELFDRGAKWSRMFHSEEYFLDPFAGKLVIEKKLFLKASKMRVRMTAKTTMNETKVDSYIVAIDLFHANT